jgi:hypothetical protein
MKTHQKLIVRSYMSVLTPMGTDMPRNWDFGRQVASLDQFLISFHEHLILFVFFISKRISLGKSLQTSIFKEIHKTNL